LVSRFSFSDIGIYIRLAWAWEDFMTTRPESEKSVWKVAKKIR
jgi:hypothetical protein